MIKHIGRHNNKKIIVLFRQVPNEDHMCLVAYSETLARHLHDDIMRVLESAVGQQSKDFADALHRNVGSDGRNLLEVLHKEGHIKKVQTAQVLITPNTNTTIRLDELNKILNEMSKGEDAVKKLEEMDKSGGFGTGNKRRPGPPVEVKTTSADVTGDVPVASSTGTISDDSLAQSLKQQAEKMANEARILLAESDRLMKEAAALLPPVLESNVNTKPKAKKTTKVKAN
jgi:hypothetical protein